ncbi:MAG: ornithine cyclodeaminase family protein [Fusobacteriaceae bacterium]
MLILKKNDFEKKITMEEIIMIIEKSMISYEEKTAISPLRTHVSVKKNNGTALFMPAYIPKLKALGVKIVSVFPNNYLKNKDVVLGEMILLDDETGEIISIMDGTFLTQIRTGGVGAIGIKYLSNIESEVMGIIGAGGQAEQQIKGALSVRKLKKIKIYDLDISKSLELIKKISKIYKNINFEVARDSDECIKDADIIVTITTSRTPVFDYKKVKKGCHINGIGSYTKEMNEVPHELLKEFKVISVDTKVAVLESGDLVENIECREISSIIKNGFKRDKKDITFFKSTGNAIFDVAVAKQIYNKCINKL